MDDDVLSDEETVKIYPVKGAKRNLEEDKGDSNQKNLESEKPTAKPKRRKTEYCFTVRDY